MPRPPKIPSADAHQLRQLGESGALTAAQAVALEGLLRERLPWRLWAERVLLAIGTGLTLAGIIFFFAYNWAQLAPVHKFIIVEGGIVLAALAAWRAGLATLGGKISLFATCVLTGVFLAVHGQVYQTGADTWLLFAAWALFILPWVCLARFAALWMLWLGLAETGFILWWVASHFFWRFDEFLNLLNWIAVVNAIALTGREVAVCRGQEWADEGWVRAVLIVKVFANTGFMTCVWIIGFGNWREEVPPFSPLLYFVATFLGFYIYRRVFPSAASLAVIVLTGSAVLVTGLGRLFISEVNSHDQPGVFLFMMLVAAAIFGFAVRWLRRLGAQIHAEETAVGVTGETTATP